MEFCIFSTMLMMKFSHICILLTNSKKNHRHWGGGSRLYRSRRMMTRPGWCVIQKRNDILISLTHYARQSSNKIWCNINVAVAVVSLSYFFVWTLAQTYKLVEFLQGPTFHWLDVAQISCWIFFQQLDWACIYLFNLFLFFQNEALCCGKL